MSARPKFKFSAFYLVILAWSAYFVFFFTRALTLNEDGLYAGHEYIWSDWALHIGLASIFAYKNPALWFAYHPVFADGHLTYPFVADLISGFLMRAGFSIPQAMIIPSIIISILLISGLTTLFTLLCGSKNKAALAMSIFFLSGCLGFVTLGQKIFLDHHALNIDLLATRFTGVLGNNIATYFVPQRAFFLGLTLSVWALYGLFTAIQSLDKNKKIPPQLRMQLFVCGIALGCLPIVHMHSLISLCFILSPLLLYKLYQRKFDLLYFVLPLIVLATYLYFSFIHSGITVSDFLRFRPGYQSESFGAWLNFWFWEWGILLSLAIGAFVFLFRKLNLELKLFYFGFFLLFIVANLILFQPTDWDNAKLFVWVNLGFSLLAAQLLAYAWERNGRARIASVITVLFLCFTGALELTRLQLVEHNTYGMLSKDEIALGQMARDKTDPLSRFLTKPVHNHWVMVVGARPVLLGYNGWAMNFGFQVEEIEEDTKTIYQGGPGSLELIRKHKLSYVVIGPQELKEFSPDVSFFANNFPVAFSNADTTVYDLRSAMK
jgi:hypothetical protein